MSTDSPVDAPDTQGVQDIPGEPRQKILRVAGARRARLTPAPGAVGEPTAPELDFSEPAGAGDGAAGPNDERMLREVPPHY